MNTFPPASFGEQLQRALDYKGLSQTDLANKMNKDRSQINHWISGLSTPRGKSIQQILNVLPGIYIQKSTTAPGLYDLTISEERERLYKSDSFELGNPQVSEKTHNIYKEMIVKSLERSLSMLNDAIIHIHKLPLDANLSRNTSKLIAAHYLLGSVLKEEFNMPYKEPQVRQEVQTISYNTSKTSE